MLHPSKSSAGAIAILFAGVTMMATLTAWAQTLNKPAPAAPAPGQSVTLDETQNKALDSYSQITRIHDNWSLQCRERSGNEQCYIETVIRQTKPHVRELIVLRVMPHDGKLAGTIVTPNRVLLQNGVTLSAGNEEFKADFLICGPQNCNAAFETDLGARERLSQLPEIFVSFHVPAPNQGAQSQQEIRLPINLTGFAAALKDLTEIEGGQE